MSTMAGYSKIRPSDLFHCILLLFLGAEWVKQLPIWLCSNDSIN